MASSDDEGGSGDEGSSYADEGDAESDFFAELIQAEAAAEALAEAQVAGGTPASLKAAGPGLRGRSSARDGVFKREAREAFVAMGLLGDSRIPHAQVLARAPDAASGGRKTCPLPLWTLIQEHGGYVEEGRFGVSRRRIVGQFNLWRVATFSRGGAPLVAPKIHEEALRAVLDQVVPPAGVLMDETAAFRIVASSANDCRRKASFVEVWKGDPCLCFWRGQRKNIIGILMEGALDHPGEAGYVARHTHTDEVYDELFGILASANVELAATKCDFCCEDVRGVDVCDCIEVVAVEAYDMFVMLLLKHVGAYSGADAKAFCSPPPGAALPIASTDALYNIAGALLRKVSKRTAFTARGMSAADQEGCVAFVVAHSTTQKAAQDAEMPAGKVIRTQYSVDSLTFVSPSLYAFFCELELIYWYNLNLRCNADLAADTLKQLDLFARTQASVIRAWRQCMQTIVMKHHPCLRGDDTAAGLSRLTEQVADATLRSKVVFNLFASTYTKVRGKEFANVHAEQCRNAAAIARQSSTRNMLAGQIVARMVGTEKEGGEKKESGGSK
jgi:hypothetical protein